MRTTSKCLFLVLWLALHAATAEQSSVTPPQDGDAAPSDVDDPAFEVFKSPDGESYFPTGKESYYTKYYRAANLPSLLTKRAPKGHVTFRLGILPSFTKPLFLTYARTADGPAIEVTRLSLRSVENRLELGPIELTGKVVVGDRLAKRLEADAIDPNTRLPLRQYTEEQRQLLQPLDGCTWILEVCTDSDYTMEDVSSPGWMGNVDPEVIEKNNLPKVDTRFFIEFCDRLLDVTDLKAPENGAPEND